MKGENVPLIDAFLQVIRWPLGTCSSPYRSKASSAPIPNNSHHSSSSSVHLIHPTPTTHLRVSKKSRERRRGESKTTNSKDRRTTISTHLMIPLNISSIITNSIRYPKIDQFQRSFHQYEIRRFQIGMDDFLFVDDLDCFEHLWSGVLDEVWCAYMG